MEDIIFPVLGILFGLGIPILIVAGIVYLILKLRKGTSIKFSYRICLRVYFYVVILISIGLAGIGGASTIIRVGLGEAIGKEFSYGDIYREHQERLERGNDNDHYYSDRNWGDRTLPEMLNLEIKGHLIDGISLAIIGLLLLIIHIVGRIWLETDSERLDMLRRLYLFSGLVVFAILSIISLAAGIPGTLRYAFAVNQSYGSPAEPLSIAIATLPIWVCFLVATLSNIRGTD
jgi:hypothetical protein